MEIDQAYSIGFQRGRDWWGYANAGQKYRLAKAMRKVNYETARLADASKQESQSDRVAFTILESTRRNPENARAFWEECGESPEVLADPQWIRGFIDGALGMWRPD